MQVKITPELGENDAIISVEGQPLSAGKWGCFRVLAQVREVGSQRFADEHKVSQGIRGMFIYPNTVQVEIGQLLRVRWINNGLHIVGEDGTRVRTDQS